jgi:hypothetical protein
MGQFQGASEVAAGLAAIVSVGQMDLERVLAGWIF